MYKTVLLPIDLAHRESWEKALPTALEIAGNGGEVHLLGIVHEVGSAMVASFLPEGFEVEALEKMKAGMDEFAADHAQNGTPIHVLVGHGHVPETILKVAAKIDADLIVMAGHSPTELTSMLVSSYAGKVVRNAPVSVMVVR